MSTTHDDIEIMAMDALAALAASEIEFAAARALLDAVDDLMPSARHLFGSADRARTLIAACSSG